MRVDHDRVVIIGAGQAGAWVAITLRNLDPHRPITLIGDEAHPPYERPPLSKAILSGKAGLESALIKPEDYYEANNIELMLNRSVERIDRTAKSIVFSDGQVMPYGVLVLATGARARKLSIPGADLPQVQVLRTAADVERIKPYLAAGKRVVAIGAGFIGLEFAAVASEAGCEVTVLDAAPQAMGRVVDASVAKAIVATHQNRGVKFVLAAEIVGISAAGGQADVELRDGRKISADLIIVGIGSIPNTELAREAGLSCDDGVVVDAFGRTSDPSIYAVGDVTRHFNPLLERSLRLESWQNAQNQGIAVAKAIAGAPEPYAELPWFWTDQYDTNLQMVGVPTSWDRVIWRGDPSSGKFTALYMLADRVVAGNALNNARDVRFLKQLILAGEAPDAAILADTSRSLAQIIKEQESR